MYVFCKYTYFTNGFFFFFQNPFVFKSDTIVLKTFLRVRPRFSIAEMRTVRMSTSPPLQRGETHDFFHVFYSAGRYLFIYYYSNRNLVGPTIKCTRALPTSIYVYVVACDSTTKNHETHIRAL